VIAAAPAAIKKVIVNLLYPPRNKAALPKRLLLVGKPGTGKTTLAKAIAYKCGYDYYVIEAPFLLNEYKNSGPQNLLREIYPLLNAGRNVVVILDELTELTDRYKKENDSDATVGAALWILLDSCAQYDNVFFIGTSNKQRKDLPVQLQSRFDEDIITIHLPHAAARKRILQRHLKDERHKINKKFLDYLVKKTNGCSAREIEKLIFKAIQFANTRIPRRYTVLPMDFEKALKLWKPWWHPMVIYQTLEPHLQPFFKTAFPIILQTIGLAHSIYSSERQHRNSERGLALQEASHALQIAGQAMQEKLHKESMDHQGEVFAHQQKAHDQSMEQQRKSFKHQKKAHKESMEHQQKAFKHQKKMNRKTIEHQTDSSDIQFLSLLISAASFIKPFFLMF
jgi:ATP-dependent 26S proteasome regulatory subunit